MNLKSEAVSNIADRSVLDQTHGVLGQLLPGGVAQGHLLQVCASGGLDSDGILANAFTALNLGGGNFRSATDDAIFFNHFASVAT